ACRLEALRGERPHRGILRGVISSRRSVPASPRAPTPFAVDDQAPAAGAEHAAHLAETLASLGGSAVGEYVSHDRDVKAVCVERELPPGTGRGLDQRPLARRDRGGGGN